MKKRMVVIWFRQLLCDWMLRRKPALKETAFALIATEAGRRIIKASNDRAQGKGVFPGMVLADCKALVPDLQTFDHKEEQAEKLLRSLAEWCTRFTPYASVSLPESVILDASGCTHLWRGEEAYLNDIAKKFGELGYSIRVAMTDTIGAAWALSHYGDRRICLIEKGKHAAAISFLPPEALRLDAAVSEKLHKLGLKKIGSFQSLPNTALRRRFGPDILKRLYQTLGDLPEVTEPVRPLAPYSESLHCLEPIRTREGIEIALKNLLEQLCLRLNKESKGLRDCTLRGYRIDGNIQQVTISTARPVRNAQHLFKLFELKIGNIRPALGIELFMLETTVVEELLGNQDALWAVNSGSEAIIAELLDRVKGKTGNSSVTRYLPAEHYWPERAIKTATSFAEEPAIEWRTDVPRPLHLLTIPERIDVSVPIPDYPPLTFRYKEKLHTVKKADGPERIEQEWWLQSGLYRDYYCVEDEEGSRYWLFRSGDYKSGNAEWFMHGFFA